MKTLKQMTTPHCLCGVSIQVQIWETRHPYKFKKIFLHLPRLEREVFHCGSKEMRLNYYLVKPYSSWISKIFLLSEGSSRGKGAINFLNK